MIEYLANLLLSVPTIFADSYRVSLGLPGWVSGKYPPANAGDAGCISGSGGSPGEGNGNPLQYSCLGNPMDRGTWQATVHGVCSWT